MSNRSVYKSSGEIILASGSPRRKELLSGIGLDLKIEVPGHPEDILPGEDAGSYAARVAREKAELVAVKNPDAWVIGADTTVVLRGVIYGKPENTADAKRMLMELQGTVHQVVGGFAVINKSRSVEHVEVHSTDVEMRPVSEEEAEAYAACGEPMDKAGAYAIQEAGGAFVSRISGSFSNVIGLELSALIEALIRLGAIVPFS